MAVVKVNHPEVRQTDVDIPSIATITTVDAQLPAPFCKVGELYLIWIDIGASGLDNGLGYVATAHCEAPDTLDVRFVNPTAGAINPAPGIEMTYLKL